MDRRAALIALAVLSLVEGRAHAEPGEVSAGTRVLVQPAASDVLLVLTPSVSGHADVLRWLRADVSWSADVVTGATPRVYGSPDVVSAATAFSEVRNSVGAGLEAHAGPLGISAGYGYGTESDYRSHLVHGGARLDLFEHNTVVAASYSHSFNRVCDLAQPGVAVTARQPLDASRGCFQDLPQLVADTLDVDAAELSLVQTLGRSSLLAIAGSYEHASGLQSNPYRAVRLWGGLAQAEESHPRLRDRGSLTLRLRQAIGAVGALGVDVRGYRDTWGISALTIEGKWEQALRFTDGKWRWGARLRGYLQSRAVFYRDAGEPDSYERAGPAGRYFTADQELAPLADLLAGAHLVRHYAPPPDRRLGGVLDGLDVTLSFDWMRIFALTPTPPNAARASGFASALVLGLSMTGAF